MSKKKEVLADNELEAKRVSIYQVKSSHPFFAFCDDLTFCAKNLYNLANYYLRQCFIFHKREKPEYHFSNGTPNRLMTPEEIQDATNEIKTNYISDFDYDTEYQKTQDITVLKELYQNSGSNYEKLQIYRIMFNENSSNSVIKKFVNEAFHIENDYLFQLNPCEYDTVPQYIIDECDKDILEICPQG